MAQLGNFPTRTAAVTDQIREDIIAMRLKPGTVIRDNDLAAHYGVSSSPIREALAQMQAERLVEILPNKTKFVSRISRDIVEDFLQIHAILVKACFELGVGKLTAQNIENMRLAWLDLSEAGPQQDSAAFLKRAWHFLDPIYRGSGNAELRRQVGLHGTWLRRLISLLDRELFFVMVTENYKLVLNCLIAGDIESACLNHMLLLKRFQATVLDLDLPEGAFTVPSRRKKASA